MSVLWPFLIAVVLVSEAEDGDARATCMLVGGDPSALVVDAASNGPTAATAQDDGQVLASFPADVSAVDTIEPVVDMAAALACLVDVSELPPGATLVDVRNAAEARAAWLDGVIHEPALPQVGSRPVFRGQDLFLFGSGKDDARIAQGCARIAAHEGAGAIRVVRGGLAALVAAGHRPQGDPVAIRRLNLLTPLELHRVVSSGPVRVLDAGGDTSAIGRGTGVAGELPASARRVTAAELMSRRAADAFASVVVLPEGQAPESWLAEPGNAPASPVLFFAEGWQAYGAHIERNQERVLARTGHLLARCGGQGG